MDKTDFHYLNILRGASILRVMLVHLGLSWFYPPYSQYVGIFFPVLFFVSGAVSYGSFSRNSSIKQYARKRLVDTLLPYYVFMLIVLVLGFFTEGNLYLVSFEELLKWIFISPTLSEIDFPIGQIWFIKTLIIIHLISVPIFKYAISKFWVLPILLGLSVAVNFSSEYFPLKDIFEFLPFSGFIGVSAYWNATMLLSCYLAGAMLYDIRYQEKRWSCTLLIIFSFLTFSALFVSNFNFDYYYHFGKKSAFYVCLALLIIVLLFELKKPITNFVLVASPVRWLLQYASRHSYALFLLHTVVLFYVEKLFGWNDLSGNTLLAICRLILVVFLTMLIAPIFTSFIKYLKEKFQG